MKKQNKDKKRNNSLYLLIQHKRFMVALILGAVFLVINKYYVAPDTTPPVPPEMEPKISTDSTVYGKPNIVFILLDDLDERQTDYWKILHKTRELLARKGITFTNAFSPDPICCPARASILTGKYPHNTHVYTNAGKDGGLQPFMAYGNEEKTYAVDMQNAGYRTVHMGKYLNGIEHVRTHIPPGWSEWYGGVDDFIYLGYGYTLNENGTFVRYGFRPEDYQTDVISNKAVDFIQRSEQDDDRPFLLQLWPTAPHVPIPPALRHLKHPYKNASLPLTANTYEPDITDKPQWFQEGARAGRKEIIWNELDYRNRMGSLYAVDDLISSVVAALDKNNELENTYIILASDNGYNLGSHRLLHKMAPYEESIRIPFVVFGPGIPADSTSDELILLTDIAPTFMEIGGLSRKPDYDGRSLLPLLGGEEADSWRKDMLLEYKGGGTVGDIHLGLLQFVYNYFVPHHDIPSYTAVRTKDMLYVEWYHDVEQNGYHEYELYDLQADPFQLQNLLSNKTKQKEYLTQRQALSKRLSELQDCKGSSCW